MTNRITEGEQDWRNVLADYRYLRATLNTLTQPGRQLSVEELVDSALNHDTMHGDTAMVILIQLEADHVALRDAREALAVAERYIHLLGQTFSANEFVKAKQEARTAWLVAWAESFPSDASRAAVSNDKFYRERAALRQPASGGQA